MTDQRLPTSLIITGEFFGFVPNNDDPGQRRKAFSGDGTVRGKKKETSNARGTRFL